MKTKLFASAFLLAAFAINAQTTEKKQSTVHIKKVEVINGVETITDTTFTTNDPSAIELGNGNNIQTINIIGDEKDSKMEKVVIINDEVVNGEGSNVKVIRKGEGAIPEVELQKIMKEVELEMKEAQKQMKLSEKDAKISEQSMKETEQALKELEIELREMDKKSDGKKGVSKVIIVNDDNTNGDGKIEKKTTAVVILKMNIKDITPEEKQRLGNQIGNADNKLEMDNMKMYPNPNNGKFNLNFNLKNKADAEVTVYNMEGKQVYNEKLPNFSGDYNKAIDISSNSKGIYFVKIEQGKHSQVKKIVLD